MSEQSQIDQVLTLLNAALPNDKPAYDIDDIPAERPAEYVEVTIVRRYGGVNRLCDRAQTTGWRIGLRFVSRQYAYNCRQMRELSRAALEYSRITVDGRDSTRIQYEGGEPIGDDEGWYSGYDTLTYAI